jgi:peptide/nickel transport system substrate-binding protein
MSPDKQDGETADGVDGLVRRRTLLSGAAGGFVMLAGCSSDGSSGTSTPTDADTDTQSGDGGGSSDSGGGGSSEDDMFRAVTGNQTNNLNYNVWNPQTWSDNMAQGRMTMLDPVNGAWVSKEVGGPLEDWSVTEGEEVEFTIIDGLKWHSGEDYTAEDAVTHLRLNRLVFGDDQGPWTYADQVMARDDRTFALSLTTDAAWEVIRSEIFNVTALASPTSVYRENLEKLQDATTDQAAQEAKNELLQRQITELPPPTGFTPWKPVERTSTYIESELWEEHPVASEINYSRVRGMDLQRVKEQGIQMIKSGELDTMRQPFSRSTLESFGDNIRVDSKYRTRSAALLFNQQHPLLSDHRVRRGLAYMLDRERIAQVIFPPAPRLVEIPAGIPRSTIGDVIGDASSEFMAYQQDRERGAELLREAGLSQSGGEWRGPDGGALNFTLISPPAKALDRAASVVSQQLQQVGIGHELVNKPGSEMWSAVFPEGQMDMVPGPWAIGPHPIRAMRRTFVNDNPPNIQIGDEISYPSTVGDLSSSEKTVNPVEMIDQAVSASAEERSRIMRELAWAYNSRLICMDINQKALFTIWNTDNWEIPPLETTGMGVEQIAKHAVKSSFVQHK